METLQHTLAASDSLKIAVAILSACSIALVAALGGMAFVVLLVALLLSVHVYRDPQSSVVVGPLFLFAVNVFYPSAARWDATNTDPAFEMRYWAVGLLLITLAAVWKLRHTCLPAIPTSLRYFLLAAVASSIFGSLRGNEISYVARQLFGSALLVVYFAFARQFASEEAFTRIMRNYALPCVLAFLLYYAWIFPQAGIHKEITSLPTQSGVLAILFAVRPGWKWRLPAALMMLPPLLLVERRALVAFVLAMLLLVIMRSTSRVKRLFLEVVAAVVILFSLVPALGAMLVDAAMGTSIESVLPAGARDASSLQDRNIQLVEAALIVKRSPLFGDGMGSSFNWFSEARGDMQQAYVDNGWAYVASKMGLLGLVTFVWFLVVMLKRIPGNSIALSACFLSMLLLVMFTEPLFFQFTTAPLLGGILGMLYSRRDCLTSQPC